MLRGMSHEWAVPDATTIGCVAENFAKLDVASARCVVQALRSDGCGRVWKTALLHHEGVSFLRREITRLCRRLCLPRPHANEVAYARLALHAGHERAFQWECMALEHLAQHADEGAEYPTAAERLVRMVDLRVEEAGIEALRERWGLVRRDIADRIGTLEGREWDDQILGSRKGSVFLDPGHHLWRSMVIEASFGVGKDREGRRRF